MWIKGVHSDGTSRDGNEKYNSGDIKVGKNGLNIHYASDVDTAFYHIGGRDSIDNIKFFKIKPLTEIICSNTGNEYSYDEKNIPSYSKEFQSEKIEVLEELTTEYLLKNSKAYKECYEKNKIK